MEHIFLMSLIMLVQSSAFAASKCLVMDREDYAVEVNGNKAAFFDNNEWVVLNLKANTNPWLTTMTYEGADSTGGLVRVQIDNAETVQRDEFVQFEEGVLKKLGIHCSYVQASELNSGI